MSGPDQSGTGAAAWHAAAEPADRQFGFRSHPYFLRGTKRKSPVKGLKVERVSLRRQAGRSVSAAVSESKTSMRTFRHGGQVQSRSAAAWGRTHRLNRCQRLALRPSTIRDVASVQALAIQSSRPPPPKTGIAVREILKGCQQTGPVSVDCVREVFEGTASFSSGSAPELIAQHRL